MHKSESRKGNETIINTNTGPGVESYSLRFEKIQKELDDAEQHSRHSSLRIYSIPMPERGPETDSYCVEKVRAVINSQKVQVTSNSSYSEDKEIILVGDTN